MSGVTVGIDLGTKFTKTIVMKDGRIVGDAVSEMNEGGEKIEEHARREIDATLESTGLSRETVRGICVTGVLRKAVTFTDNQITEPTCSALGAVHSVPSARTVLDIGYQAARGMSCDSEGKIVKLKKSDMCASGTGAFIDAMATALNVGVKEMIELALNGKNTVDISSQCVVFAESEVVTLINSEVNRNDLALGIHNSIALRLSSLLRRVGTKADVVLVGGLASNAAFVECFRKMALDDYDIGKVIIPDNAIMAGAVGAALLAEREG